MSIGIARIMGYKFNENFNMPYIATSIVDFWRRWHISLSSWLKDYLYIPLGGNRRGNTRTYFNLMLTMALGGLWHGAAWTFVAWGVLHGFALCVNKLFASYIANTKKIIGDHIPSILGWVITMMTVMVGWVFFRTQNFSSAILILKQMFFWGNGIRWLCPWAIFLLSITILIHIIYAFGLTTLFELNAKKWYTSVILLFLIWITIIWCPKGFQPFIYLQF
jgi:alginate O-acetyltransferase complex protein AlgI